MARPNTLLVPVLACSALLLPALALASPPPEADPLAGAMGPTPAVDEAVVVPAEPPATPDPVDIEPAAHHFPEDDYEPEYIEEPYQPPPPPEPSPEPKRTTLELQSGYIGFGIAPGVSLHPKGFHPNTRFELEFGGTLEHDFRDLGLSFGVATHITPYYGRKKPSFGADVTSTTMLGPVYIRTGLGAVGGLPRGHLLDERLPGIGGVVGVGLNFGRQPMIRVGVDYDLRVTTKLEPVHTLFLTVRIACCRED